MATHGNIRDFPEHDGASPMSRETVDAKWATWRNFKQLAITGGVAALVVLLLIWWVTY
jgi:hypothetical protein